MLLEDFFFVKLMPEQAALAKAHGCTLVAANAQQVATLSMQRRVFWIDGTPWLVMRGDGFFETAATLAQLLREPAPVPAAAPAHEDMAREETASDEAASDKRASDAAAEGTADEAAPAETVAAERPAEPPRGISPETAAPEPVLPAVVPPVLPPALAQPVAPPSSTLAVTASMVSHYLAATPVETKDLPELIRGIHRSVVALSSTAGRS